MMTPLQALDDQIALWAASIQNPVLTPILVVITYCGTAGIVWILLILLLLFFQKTRRIAVVMAISLVMAWVVGDVIIKPLVARPRPFLVLPNLPEIIPREMSYSFPSGHTISSFAAAVPLWFYSWKLALPATLFAGAIGFSRIYLFCHFFTDVLAGALLGSAIAVTLCVLYLISFGRRLPLKQMNN